MAHPHYHPTPQTIKEEYEWIMNVDMTAIDERMMFTSKHSKVSGYAYMHTQNSL